MRVSVITITRNDLEGLRRTIESVNAQDYGDIEHIIVDADSTDGSKGLLASLDGIAYVSEPDNGRYDGMNKGVRMSTGDVVWFMHSSDQFADDQTISYVARQISGVTERFDWGYGLSAIVKGDAAVGIGGQVPFNLSRFLLGGKIVPHQATIYARRFFDELGGYRTDFGLAADQEFMVRCAVKSSPAVWPRVLCIFDGHGAGSTRGVYEHFQDMTKARLDNKVVVLPSPYLDYSASMYLLIFTKAARATRRIMRGFAPRHAGNKVTNV